MYLGFENSPDLQFVFDRLIDWKAILKQHNPKGEDDPAETIATFRDVLLQVDAWCRDSLYAKAAELDQAGAGELKDGKYTPSKPLQEFCREAMELGLFSLVCPTRFGGQGFPDAMAFLIIHILARASNAMAIHYSFVSSSVRMLDTYADEAICAKYIPKLIAGELLGSMALTEPHAGSDLSNMRTLATQQADGSWVLNGEKCFITNGTGGMSFVLAKTNRDDRDINKLSLFLVLSESSQQPVYQILNLENKIGLHGSPTCGIRFTNTPAILVRKDKAGMGGMFDLMNSARADTGSQAASGALSALAYAKAYAEDRECFGKKVADLPLMRANFLAWETEARAVLLFVMDAVTDFDRSKCLTLKLERTSDLSEDEKIQQKAFNRRLRLVTPLIKMYGSETYTRLSVKAIQALGGHGMMRDHAVERWHRDSFGPLLYEGTTQIQSLMVIKDLLKDLFQNPLPYLQSFMGPVSARLNRKRSKTEAASTKLRDLFNRSLATLVLRVFYPRMDDKNAWRNLPKIFGKQALQDTEKVEKFLERAEPIAMALALVETAAVLHNHAVLDPSREELALGYCNLVYPRMLALTHEFSSAQ